MAKNCMEITIQKISVTEELWEIKVVESQGSSISSDLQI
jgi:hypothetical protein